MLGLEWEVSLRVSLARSSYSGRAGVAGKGPGGQGPRATGGLGGVSGLAVSAGRPVVEAASRQILSERTSPGQARSSSWL